MRTPALSPRLKLLCNFIRPGSRVADIGADHAYVCVSLVLSGRSPACLACDINQGPLARAQKTVDEYSLAQKVSLRLSDGLDAVSKDEADDIVIAGMGGELIAAIIKRCGWLCDPRYRLVLQPMTAQEELRGSLYENGFEITQEAVAREGQKLYLVLAARYCGRVQQKDEYFRIAGLLPGCSDHLAADYLLWQAQILQKAANGLLKSADGERHAHELLLLASKLQQAAGKKEES